MEGSASQAGFYYQNIVAALKIVECLFFETDITHIFLENYEKGKHIDDIIIHRKQSIEYYQVKWSNDGGKSYTLHNLLSSENGKKSLFKQLAEGYSSIKTVDKQFSITLYTTKTEGKQKRPKSGLHHSLVQLRTKIIEPLKLTSGHYNKLSNFEEYKETLEKVRVECNLSERDFNDFLKKIVFKFNQEPINQLRNAIKFKLNKLGIEENLFEPLLDGVVNWSISGASITKNDVLKQLGISDRFEDKLSQYFNIVEDKFYVQNNDFSRKLTTALTELKGGYIFIEGSPGIGKSTALTKFQQDHPETVLSYYCFIPDAKNDFGELRHKSRYFLKSLCIAIEKNFPDVDFPSKYSDRFEEKLSSYITTLGTLEKRVIFIIDGLDHVYRDIEFKESSLLNQIKGNLPDGVFFILSSQYKAVLSSSVLNKINSDKRRHIVVSKFSQSEIAEYLNNRGLESKECLSQIEEISGGIPLYLHYISELLINIEKRDYPHFLDEMPSLIEGKISSYHEYLFEKIHNDQFVVWVLTILAYRIEYSNDSTISEILHLAGIHKDKIEVSKVLKKYSHLLRQNNGRSYSIFHNSFREFILSKTMNYRDDFNKALVLYYENTPYSDEAYRNYFRHLKEIGQFEKIIATTTIDWIKSAWSNFRTIEEIESNLDIALAACVEVTSLSEFIRITFLKAQVSKISWNLEHSELDFSMLFLNAGLEQNSLRSIWDGDLVLVGKVYFAFYLCKYYSKAGVLLPENLITQGLSKSFTNGDVKDHTIICQAESLISNDIVDLFNDIDTIKWVKSDEIRNDYIKKNYSEKSNTKTNNKIKIKVINFLLENKKHSTLLVLLEEYKNDENIHYHIQVALFKLLLSVDKKTSIKILQSINFKSLSNKRYLNLISYCTGHLTDDEIVKFIDTKNREITPPVILDKLVNEEGGNYAIHKDIISLFNNLKPIWILQPELIKQLLLQVSLLQYPTREIYNSIFHLSELWYKNRTSTLSEIEKISLFKKALNELFINKNDEIRKFNYGLFDSPLDHSFIQRSIVWIFVKIFELANEILDERGITTLLEFWFSLEERNEGYRHHNISMEIAKVLNSNKEIRNPKLTLRLIQHSEKVAKDTEETSTLLEYLGEVANTYGLCGFQEEFKRIYNQLFEIAFGVGYKKDYQASYILDSLRRVHKINPEDSLNKLSVIFRIQDQLSDAGTGRMHHICLSDFIGFIMESYPELAFSLIEKEENSISRGETLDRILKKIIKTTDKESLPLFFSVIKTLPRWSDGNYFIDLSAILFERTLELKEEEFATKIVEDVEYNITIELDKPSLFEKFSKIIQEQGIEASKFNLPTTNKKIVKEPALEELKTNRKSRGEKFSRSYVLPTITELINLFEEDIDKFYQLLNSVIKTRNYNIRNRTIRNDFFRLISTFEIFHKALPSANQVDLTKNRIKLIRYFLEFKNEIVNSNTERKIEALELDEIFNRLVSKIDDDFQKNAFKAFIKNEFDLNRWKDQTLRLINEPRPRMFSDIFSEEQIFQIVDKVSILKHNELINFIENWTDYKTYAFAMLKIAKRVVSLEQEKAMVILSDLAGNKNGGFLSPVRYTIGKTDHEIIRTILGINKNFGKKFILQSYISQNGKYNDSLIGAIDKLLLYEDYFDDLNVPEAYYIANLQYNEGLAKGLPIKDNDYGFIANHKERMTFPEIIIKYLVGLLNYPVVKIREATLQSLFDLVSDNTKYLNQLFRFGIIEGNENQIEYSLIVLKALALEKSEALIHLKKELFQISASKKHFNILESISEILRLVNTKQNGFLSTIEINTLKMLTQKSPIILDRGFISTKKSRSFLYSKYQVLLMRKINQNEIDNTEIQTDVYSSLVKKGYESYTADMEGRVHRGYNINSNFDAIEVQSPYYDEVKSSLNYVFLDKIKRGCVEDSFVKRINQEFRLHDPSNLLYKKRLRPSYINWLTTNSEEEFLAFDDLEKLKHDFLNRENDYITLYESGSQRPISEYSKNSYTCYFEAIAFLKQKGNKGAFQNLEDSPITPHLEHNNLYVYELPTKVTSINFPINAIRPIIEISLNNFRGEQNLACAFLLSDCLSDLGIPNLNLLEVLKDNNQSCLEAFYWQNAYTSRGGRRRYKPTSEGFTLKIKRKALMAFLDKTEMALCYDISLSRSTTKYKPEDNMVWHEWRERVEVD